MKKNAVRAWVILAVCLVAYRMAIFLLPVPKTSVFYVSRAFTLIAILAQVYVMWTAFGQGRDTRSKAYGLPLLKVGMVYLAVQMVAGLVFMAVGERVPLWVPVVLYIALLGLAALGLVGADIAREEAAHQDDKMAERTAVMRTLQSRVSALPALARDEELAAGLRKFAEAVRYSDPVSDGALEEVEAALTAGVTDLERALAEEDGPAATALVEKATAILAERNRLCKLGKGHGA